MRTWIFAAIIGLACCGQAWAWDDDYPFGSTKKIDEMQVQFGPPSAPLGDTDRDDVQRYLSNKQDYDEAMGRLQIYNQRKLEKLAEQQRKLVLTFRELKTYTATR